jgi:hypothetical protein
MKHNFGTGPRESFGLMKNKLFRNGSLDLFYGVVICNSDRKLLTLFPYSKNWHHVPDIFLGLFHILKGEILTYVFVREMKLFSVTMINYEKS